jgi:serine protease inhibitor
MMAVEHINGLTKRWSATAGPRSAVWSALGVWPLLAFLADGADDATRTELAAALGLAPEDAAGAARDLLASLNKSPAVSAALGVWTRDQVRLHQTWLDRLPQDVHGELTGVPGEDQKKLDAWASDRTDGLIPQLPIPITPDTMLVLASALSVSLGWRQQFDQGPAKSTSPWARHGRLSALFRSSGDLSVLRVADTPIGQVTAVTVEGDRDVDVHLVLGPEDRTPAEVLTIGVDLAAMDSPGAPRHPMTRGTELPVGAAGPGVQVHLTEAFTPRDQLVTMTVPFRVAARHDLLEHAELFGLRHAMTGPDGHFPGISDFPLCVERAVQDAFAEFSAVGFKAGVVTAMAAVPMGMPPQKYQVRTVSAIFDRPFAFYAVDRASGLILVAGWIAEPTHQEHPQHPAQPQEASSGKARRHWQIRRPRAER